MTFWCHEPLSSFITHISYALYTPSLKVHALASELLAAIYVLDVSEGHKPYWLYSRITYD